MASMKISSCFLILLVYFSNLLSSLHASQERNIIATDQVEAVKTRKGLMNNGGRVVTGETLYEKFRGRMMASVEVFKSEKAKEINGGAKSSIPIPGSQLFPGKCEKIVEKAGLIECKKITVSDLTEEVDDKEFVAFNADYRAPRHHPPKNN